MTNNDFNNAPFVYLALANLRVQSEFSRSNFSIQRVPRVGVEKETEKVDK